MGDYCSGHSVPPVRTVYAKPVFAVGNTAQEQLPLETLYNHIDYVDVISAREFGLESIFPNRVLLCVLVVARPQALGEMEMLIAGSSRESVPVGSYRAEGNTLFLEENGLTMSVPIGDSAAALLAELAQRRVSATTCLGAITAWCVEFCIQLCCPKELL